MIPKFRAWHELDNCMYDVQSIDLFWGAVRVCFLIGEPGKPQIKQTRTLDMRDIKLMQFAGLRDKAGCEVYKDDIVKIVRDEWDDKDTGVIGIVDYGDGAFFIKTPTGGYYRWMDYEVEVLGNIWENPDLVDGEARE